MDGSKFKGRSANRVTIRANKAQTVILQDAFTQSNVASPEKLKTLSEKTGLYVFSFLSIWGKHLILDDLFSAPALLNSVAWNTP